MDNIYPKGQVDVRGPVAWPRDDRTVVLTLTEDATTTAVHLTPAQTRKLYETLGEALQRVYAETGKRP